jgi:hypothetical protein
MSVSRGVEWGVLLGMRKIETVEQMPDEYRQVILKLLAALASTEFASVEQHHPWINKVRRRRIAISRRRSRRTRRIRASSTAVYCGRSAPRGRPRPTP